MGAAAAGLRLTDRGTGEARPNAELGPFPSRAKRPGRRGLPPPLDRVQVSILDRAPDREARIHRRLHHRQVVALELRKADRICLSRV